MILEISHQTVFEYTGPVTESYFEFRLTPVTDGCQHLLQHRARMVPDRPVRQYVDAFGNTVSYCNLMAPQQRVEVTFDSLVEVLSNPYRGQGIPPAARETPAARLQLYDFLRPTPLTAWCPEFLDFIRPLERLRSVPVREAAAALKETIYTGFQYQGAVTSAESPITDLLRHRAGVCQDFAHLMLASCRFLRLPARYVSGYVMQGDDGEEVAASHAWCEVFDPEGGWFGVDPTHNEWVEERHVRLGVGRDFRDVPPNRGVYRGEAGEEVRVVVHLRPISIEEVGVRARTLYGRTRPAAPATRQSRRPAPVSLLQQTLAEQQQQQQQ